MSRAAELAALVRAARERFRRCQAHGELNLGMAPCRYCQMESIIGRPVRSIAQIMS